MLAEIDTVTAWLRQSTIEEMHMTVCATQTGRRAGFLHPAKQQGSSLLQFWHWDVAAYYPTRMGMCTTTGSECS